MGGVLNAQAVNVPPLPGGGGGSGGGLAGLAKGASAIASVASAVAGVFQEVIGKARQFVEALSPTTLFVFDRALKSFQATVGFALEPAFLVLADAFRQVAGQILPAMQALRPVVEEIAQVVGGQMATGAKLVGSLLEGLAPALKLVADLMMVVADIVQAAVATGLQPVIMVLSLALKALAAALSPLIDLLKVGGQMFASIGQVWEVLSAVFSSLVQTLGQAIAALFGTSWADAIKGTMQMLQDATRGAIRAILLFTATVLKFFGFEGALGRLISDLSPKRGLEGAASGARIQSFDQVARDLATASFTAAGGGTEGKQVDLSSILTEMRDIHSGMSEGLVGVKNLLEDIEELVNQLVQARDYAREKIKEGKSFGWGFLRGAMGGTLGG
jgi:hypothetical protein